MVGVVFVASGYHHLKDQAPEQKCRNGQGLTIFLVLQKSPAVWRRLWRLTQLARSDSFSSCGRHPEKNLRWHTGSGARKHRAALRPSLCRHDLVICSPTWSIRAIEVLTLADAELADARPHI